MLLCRPVPPAQVYAELLRLARRVGLTVRVERLELGPADGKGGLCWLRGRPTLLLEEAAPVLDKVGVLAEALARFDLEPLYVPPFVRARIETRRLLARRALTPVRIEPAEPRRRPEPMGQVLPLRRRPRPATPARG